MPAASIQLRARAELERRRREHLRALEPVSATPLRDLILRWHPGYQLDRHSEVMIAAVQRLLDGEIAKLFIAAPPQSGKSLLTRFAAACRVKSHPHLWVGLSSYGADLANTLSRGARDVYLRSGGVIRDDASGVETWQTPKDGGLWAYGVGGSQTGKPSNMLILDDPIKNPQDAASPAIQKRNNDWYDANWRARWNPYGGPLLELMIGTRWDVADLQAYALAQGGWHCVILPGIYEGPPEIPPGNTLEPDWRQPGEALCEARAKFSAAVLAEEKLKLKRRWFALYQQQPRASEGGGIFRRWWFPVLAVDPSKQTNGDGKPHGLAVYRELVRAWDLAATQGGGDKTAGVLMGHRRDNGRVVVRHAIVDQLAAGGVKRLIAQTMISDGSGVTVRLPVDPGQAGKAQEEDLSQFLRAEAAKAGIVCPPLRFATPQSNKVARARNFAAGAEPVDADAGIMGNVDIVAGPWNQDYLDELHDFDGIDGHADDRTDASSDAYNTLVGENREVSIDCPY